MSPNTEMICKQFCGLCVSHFLLCAQKSNRKVNNHNFKGTRSIIDADHGTARDKAF